jgi:hypothetical protein
MSDICLECEGRCCSFRTMEISYCILNVYPCKPVEEWTNKEINETLEENIANPFELLDDNDNIINLKWFISKDDDGCCLQFECNHQMDSGKCGIYDDRPFFCKSFQCFALQEDDPRDLEDMEKQGFFNSNTENAVEVTDKVNKFLENKIEELRSKTTVLAKRG